MNHNNESVWNTALYRSTAYGTSLAGWSNGDFPVPIPPNPYTHKRNSYCSAIQITWLINTYILKGLPIQLQGQTWDLEASELHEHAAFKLACPKNWTSTPHSTCILSTGDQNLMPYDTISFCGTDGDFIVEKPDDSICILKFCPNQDK